MKPIPCFLYGTLVAFSVLPALNAATVSTSLTAPTLDSTDQYYLPGSIDEPNTINGVVGNSGANDASTYVADDRPSKLQSFTTGNNVGGYTLQSVTVQHVNWTNFTANGTFYDIQPGDTFDLRIGTISGTTLTPLLTTTATYSGAAISGGGNNGTGNYLSFVLDPTELTTLGTLAANTNYFFEITSGTGNPFFELNSTSVDGYAAGSALTGNDNSVLDANLAVTQLPGDFAFHADLQAVPEPASALLGTFGLLSLLRRRRK